MVSGSSCKEILVKYSVTFGSNFILDGFGFVRKGTLSFEKDAITLDGHKKLHVWYQILWFLILVVPCFLFGLLGVAIALTVVTYFCTSRQKLTVPMSSIQQVRRSNRIIQFTGSAEDGIVRKGCVVARTTEEALSINSKLDECMI